MGPGERDLTPLAPLGLGRLRAGPVRERRPVYVDLLPPCNAGCPAGENIQGWLAQVRAGEHEAAWRLLTADNPFPAIHGRVCYHPCERVCNRAELDGADLDPWRRALPRRPRHRARLAVRAPRGAGQGAGSSSSAPARAGSPRPTTWPGWATQVVVRDSGPAPGGMMRYGIPSYRLPRDGGRRRGGPDRGPRRALRAGPPRDRPRRRDARRRLRRGVRRRRRPPVQAGRHPQRGRGARHRRRELPARRRVRGAGSR